MLCDNTNPCFFDMLSGKVISCPKPDVRPANCLKNRNNGQTVVCSDRNSAAYYLSNPDRLDVAVIRIDGYVIKNDPGQNYTKCDYVLLIEGHACKPIAILLELKRPRRLEHAVDQIQQTLTSPALQSVQGQFSRVYGRVCGQPVPRILPSNYNSLRKKLKEQYRGDLEIRPQRGTTPVDTVTVAGNDIQLKE